MSITFPTLDLGELGAALDAEIRADDDLVVEQDSAAAAASDAAPVAGIGESAAGAAPAAEAGAGAEPVQDDADAAYRARFEADYAERSKADFARFRSNADRRYAELDRRHREAEALREESSNYIEFLERQLAEYDPEEVARFRRNREGHVREQNQKRATRQGEMELRRAFRRQKFPELYPGVDPDDPELVEAFEAGDGKRELALIRERQARLELAEARKQAAPTPATPRSPEGSPARDAQGRFLPAERTRELERLRGNDGLAAPRGAAYPEARPTSVAEARKVFQSKMAALTRRV